MCKQKRLITTIVAITLSNEYTDEHTVHWANCPISTPISILSNKQDARRSRVQAQFLNVPSKAKARRNSGQSARIRCDRTHRCTIHIRTPKLKTIDEINENNRSQKIAKIALRTSGFKVRERRFKRTEHMEKRCSALNNKLHSTPGGKD